MKKLSALVLAVVFSLVALAGCGPQKGQPASDLPQENTDVQVSEPMDYEQALARYTELESLYVDPNSKGYPPRPEDPAAFTAREIVIPLAVTDSYTPTLHFLCRTTEGNSAGRWEISNIWFAFLDTDGGVKPCRFNGNVEFWPRGENQIEYAINGDFYTDAVPKAEGTFSGAVGTDENGSFSSTVSDDTPGNHYVYFYSHETKTFQ